MPTVREPSAGMVVIRMEGGECRFLLLRAYNYWDFPKGLVEAGEDPLATALREVAEETAIRDLTLPWGTDYHETKPYSSGRKVARYYLGRTDQSEVRLPVSPELGRPEHHEYRWADREEARRLLGDRVGAALEWAAETAGC
ncbi:NUDIX domain-containing protein [Thiohalorhabdus sp.]|uniref:NUDIX domain-containing protein n=1 Tax=Thiohalorhabdus sp. TaxID=3094134 RepID=UPI002FC2B914